MSITDGSRISRVDEVVLTQAGDEGVLVNERSGKVHVVNGTAMRVWELCGAEPTVEQLLATMASEYEVEEAELRADLMSVLETFSELELVSLSPPL